MDAITADLVAEHESLDALVRDLPAEAWEVPTPAAEAGATAHTLWRGPQAPQMAPVPAPLGVTGMRSRLHIRMMALISSVVRGFITISG